MESTSLPGAIHISADLYRHLWRLPMHLAGHPPHLGADDLPNWGPGVNRETVSRDQVLSPCREHSSYLGDLSQGIHRRSRGGLEGDAGGDVGMLSMLEALRLDPEGSPGMPSSPSPSVSPVYPAQASLGPLGLAAAARGSGGGGGGGGLGAAGRPGQSTQLGVARSAGSAYGVTFESSHSHLEAEVHMLHSLAAQGLLAIGEEQQQPQHSISGSALGGGSGGASVGPIAGVAGSYEGCRSISAAGVHNLLRGSNGGVGGGAWESADVNEERWQYRGKIELKGRAALETYILQVV